MRAGVGEIVVAVVVAGGSAVAAMGGLAAVDGILDGEAAAFEVLEVVEFDGFGCGSDVCEFYVAESGGGMLVVGLKLRRVFWEWSSRVGVWRIVYPLLRPLWSIITLASSIGPARSNSFFKSSERTSKYRFPT